MILYQSEWATVHCADAREVLVDLETRSVGLLLVDPPYGVEWRSNMRTQRFDMLVGDKPADRDGVAEILHESLRALDQHRHLYCFGPADILDGLKLSAPVELIWDKTRVGMGDLTSPWGPAHEPISFAVNHYHHAGTAGQDGPPARLRKGSVLSFPPPTGRKVRHPSEKPIALLRELIESSSRSGDVVLDPCAGVGSTGVAAILSGRRCILTEVDENYAGIAADRIHRAEAAANQAALI